MLTCMQCDFEAFHMLGNVCRNAAHCACDTIHKLVGVSTCSRFLLVPGRWKPYSPDFASVKISLTASMLMQAHLVVQLPDVLSTAKAKLSAWKPRQQQALPKPLPPM